MEKDGVHAEHKKVAPATAIRGSARVPGDKSISHRLAMLAGIAEGITTIRNFAESADCKSTLECLRGLGVNITGEGDAILIEGRGLRGFLAPESELNAGNSGTTVRLMSGIIAGQSMEATFTGDASLSRRPMKRIIEPLSRFGASLTARDGNFLPLTVRGNASLRAIDYRSPVASAQVKSAVLLAGLLATGVTRVREEHPSRNHTEIALAEFGARVGVHQDFVEVEGGAPLRGASFTVPGDMSSAAFLIAAAAGIPGSNLRLTGVGVNPTRSGFVSLVQRMGGRVRIEAAPAAGGEPTADITVEGSDLTGLEVQGEWIPNIIDEIPILAVLATRTQNGIRIRDAAELRSKESDRIAAIVRNLQALDVKVEEFPDGFFVPGPQTLAGGTIDSFDDHRIAMAFAVAGLFAKEPVTIRGASCVDISFPGFFQAVERVHAA